MATYGPSNLLVHQLIARAGNLTMDEAADLYQAHAARLLIQGPAAERLALRRARQVAARAGRLHEYEEARHAAVTAWRHALPETQGPWLLVGAAIANAAGALVIEDVLDDAPFQVLIGAWQQALGRMVPVGPGLDIAERTPLFAGRASR
jgi:hypothetical protein